MIYSHGGDVIKFCGDALMCIFEPLEASEENDAHAHAHHHNPNDGRKAAALLGEVRMGKKSRARIMKALTQLSPPLPSLAAPFAGPQRHALQVLPTGDAVRSPADG